MTKTPICNNGCVLIQGWKSPFQKLRGERIKAVHESLAGLGSSVGCAVRLETRRSPVQPPRMSATFFREIFSMVILSLPLIQEWQLSVSGERMCTILVNRLDD